MFRLFETVACIFEDISNNGTTAAICSCVGATVATVFWLNFYRRRAIQTQSGKLRLYHFKPLRSSRCAWLVHELKADKNIEVVEFNPYSAVPNDKEGYINYKKTVHPNGTVPALQFPDGRVVKESGAICFLLAEHYGRLLPKRDWTSYYDWGFYATVTIDSVLKTLHGELFDDAPDREIVSNAVAELRQCFNALEQQLEGRPFICGKEFTATDVIVGFSLMWASCFKGGVLLSDYPVVRDYFQRLKKRKAFEKGMGTTNEWLAASEATEYNHKAFTKMKYEAE